MLGLPVLSLSSYVNLNEGTVLELLVRANFCLKNSEINKMSGAPGYFFICQSAENCMLEVCLIELHDVITVL